MLSTRDYDHRACGYHVAAASLNYGPAQHLLAGLQIGQKYGPDTTRPLNAILTKNYVSGVVSAQQNMTQVIIEQICIIDNYKS